MIPSSPIVGHFDGGCEPQNPAGQNSDYVGEMTKSALADDGRVF